MVRLEVMGPAIWTLLLLPLLAQSQTCVIEGRVSNLLSGGPVRKAKILLGTQGNAKYEAVTDTNGHYALGNVAPGKYVLWIQRAGFLPVVYGARGPNRPGKSIVLHAGENRKDLNFLLEPPGVITGHIYDQDGEPLSTAVVLLRESWIEGRKTIQQIAGANADDEGQYRLFGLAAGTYLVATAQTAFHPASPVPTREIYPPTFYPSTEEATGAIALKLVPGGEARNIDIRVRKTTSVNVRGAIIAQNLTPELRVNLTRRDGSPSFIRGVMFPSPGQFSAPGVTPGSYILSAISPTEYARMEVSVGTLDVDGIELRLLPTLTMAGTLKIDGDEPTAGTMFYIGFTNVETGDRITPSLVDADRKVTWQHLTPGKWTLDFAPKLPGLYLKSPLDVVIGPEGHEPIEVVISSRGASVNGKVLMNTTPVEAATVLLLRDGRVLQHFITGMDGEYTLSRIPPGKYRLLALEDIETNSWDDPQVARTFEGKEWQSKSAPASGSLGIL